jgi:hypothetical protein
MIVASSIVILLDWLFSLQTRTALDL